MLTLRFHRIFDFNCDAQVRLKLVINNNLCLVR